MIRLSNIWDAKSVRFLGVGVINTTLDLLILNSLVIILGLPVLGANTISVTIGITISYFLNRKIVFRVNSSKDPVSVVQFLKFFLVTGLSVLVIQNTVLFFAGQLIGNRDLGILKLVGVVSDINITTEFVNLNLEKVAAVLLGMVWNYTLYNFIVFNKGEIEIEEDILK